ncbi:17501_t:CDS:1, partial [Rhizophagus irregularis]
GKRVGTEPGERYMEEFIDYYYVQDEQNTHDEEEVTVEQFNENYQNLMPSTKSQLNRLKNELAITLCKKCLMPTRNQECDCWILQIEEY